MDVCKLFVVDDDCYTLELIDIMLQDDPKFKITKFSDSPRALNAIYDEKPDIVILDINLPKMNGFEICQEIKSKPETSSVSIILLTAYDSSHAKHEGLMKYNADYYLTKPVTRDTLVKCIENIIQIKSKKAPTGRNPIISSCI